MRAGVAGPELKGWTPRGDPRSRPVEVSGGAARRPEFLNAPLLEPSLTEGVLSKRAKKRASNTVCDSDEGVVRAGAGHLRACRCTRMLGNSVGP